MGIAVFADFISIKLSLSPTNLPKTSRTWPSPLSRFYLHQRSFTFRETSCCVSVLVLVYSDFFIIFSRAKKCYTSSGQISTNLILILRFPRSVSGSSKSRPSVKATCSSSNSDLQSSTVERSRERSVNSVKSM